MSVTLDKEKLHNKKEVSQAETEDEKSIVHQGFSIKRSRCIISPALNVGFQRK